MKLLKTIKPILQTLLFSSLFGIAQTTFAQNYYVSPLDMLEKQRKNTTVVEEKEKEPARENYTEDEIRKLNSLLEEENYIAFYDLFNSLNIYSSAQYQYLNTKKYIGHVPIYWLLADYYAKEKEVEETHKWLYIATIMTQQDAELCSDNTSTGASRKLMRSFPAAAELTRATPEYIYPIMKEVIFFVENVKERSNPIWACNFGEEYLPPTSQVLTPEHTWENTRRVVLARYKEKFPN